METGCSFAPCDLDDQPQRLTGPADRKLGRLPLIARPEELAVSPLKTHVSQGVYRDSQLSTTTRSILHTDSVLGVRLEPQADSSGAGIALEFKCQLALRV